MMKCSGKEFRLVRLLFAVLQEPEYLTGKGLLKSYLIGRGARQYGYAVQGGICGMKVLAER